MTKIRDERPRLWRALAPNRLFRLFVPNMDRHGRELPHLAVLHMIQDSVSDLTGGQTSFLGSGDFRPSAGAGMREETAVIETYLPEKVDDQLRSNLIALARQFGAATGQDVVLLAVGTQAFRIAIPHDQREEVTDVVVRERSLA